MDGSTVYLFTRNELGEAPADLQQALAAKFLSLTLQSDRLPAKILFYPEGVRLACAGSAVIEPLRDLEAKGVELVLCQSCLNYFGLAEQAQVGVVGGMGDIIEALAKAGKVISL